MHKFTLRFVSGALAGLGMATQALAQEQTLQLEEVIVTAQKRTETLADTPMTVNVISGEKINATSSFDFVDLNNLTSGLSIRGSGFDTNIATRGLGTELDAAVSPRVTVYLDGAFISQQRGLFGGIYDMRQVELLRGPQGTLYGQSSPAGALTLQSQNPNIEEIDGYVEQSFTEHDGTNTQAAISLPIIENELSVRLSGMYDNNQNADATNTTLDVDQENRTRDYRVVTLWQPTDSFDLRLAYHDITDKFDIDPIVKGNGIEFDDRTAVADYRSEMTNNTDVTVLETNYNFHENLTATLVSSYQNNQVSREWDGDGSAVLGQNQTVVSNVKDLWNVETRLASQGNDFWDWTVGAFYQDSESETPVFVETYVAVSPGFTVQAQTTGPALINVNQFGLFSHNTLHITDDSAVTVGLRYQTNESKASQTFDTVAFVFLPDGSLGSQVFERTTDGVPPSEKGDEEDAYTGTLKYQYNFSDDFMAYISYDRGWRAGAVNIAGEPQPPVFGRFDAEDSDNIELGYKWSVLDGRGLWNLAAYYQTYDDFQYQADSVEFRAPDETVGLATPVVNVEEAEVYGVDTEFTILLSERWTLSTSLSYNKSELSDASSVPCSSGEPVGDETWTFNTCDFTGERAGNLPEWSANVSSEYAQPFGSGNSEWYLRGLLNAESEYYSSSERTDLDSYATLDLFLGWRATARSWDARVWVKNVTDETAELNSERLPLVPDYVNGGEIESGLTWVRRQLNPRTVGVTVGYSF